MSFKDNTSMSIHYISHALTLGYDAIQDEELTKLPFLKKDLIKELQGINDEPIAQDYLQLIEENPWRSINDLDKIRNSINIKNPN